MIFALNIKVQGVQEINHRFRKVVYGVSDNKPWLERLAKQSIYPLTQKAFSKQGMPKWAKLKRGYSIWKARNYPGKGILELSGGLRKSLTSRTGAGSIYDLRKDSLTIGSKLQVGKWNLGLLHQMGTKKMAQRTIYSNEMLRRIDKDMLKFGQEHLKHAIRD